MPPNETQVNTGDTSQNTAQVSPQMTDDQHAAMLGFITTISEQLHNAQNPQQTGQPQGQQPPQTQTDLNQQPTSQAQPPQPDPNAGRIDKIEQDITSLRDEMKKTIHEEVGGIRELVKEALNNEPQ